MPTVQQLYQALTGAGLNSAQAAGAVANACFETGGGCPGGTGNFGSFNRPDCMGFWCWTSPHYSFSGGDDVAANVAYFMKTAAGSLGNTNDPCQAATNMATGFEKCAECQPTGAQTQSRCSMAKQIFAMAQSNNWGSGAGINASTSSGGGDCLAQFPLVGGCMISQSNLKALKAGLLIGAGGLTLGIGVILILSGGLKSTGAGRAAVRSYNRLPILPTTNQIGRSTRRRPAPARRRASTTRPRTSAHRNGQADRDQEDYDRYLSEGGARGGVERAPGETRLERDQATVDFF